MVVDIFLALMGGWMGTTTDRKDRNGVSLCLANGTCRFPHLFFSTSKRRIGVSQPHAAADIMGRVSATGN